MTPTSRFLLLLRRAAAFPMRPPAWARRALPALALSAALSAGFGADGHAQQEECFPSPMSEESELCLTPPADLSLTVGVGLTGGSLRLPDARGGTSGAYVYTLSPEPPAGLRFFGSPDPQFEGTPTAAQAQTEYTYTVTDFDGSTASVTFNITVAAAPPSLSFLAGIDPNFIYTIDENVPIGSEVGSPLVASGFPAGDPTWEITGGNTGNRFAITNDGTITVAAALDFETQPTSYDLTVQLTQGGEMAEIEVPVTVSNVVEPPTPLGTIAPVSLFPGGDPATVDVSTSFRQGDAALTYTVASAATAVATVAVAGSTVTITPVAEGSTTVTVTASDSNSNPMVPNTFATQEIAVTVLPLVGIMFEFSRYSTDEPAGDLEICAITEGSVAVTANVDVTFTLEERTATEPEDYRNPSSNVIRIASGATEGCVNIPIVDDDDVERDQTFVARLVSVSTEGYSLASSQTSVEIAILVDDVGLDGLTLSAGNLNPGFDPAVTTYTATVHNDVDSLTVTPVGTCCIAVNGPDVPSGTASNPIALNVGANTITIVQLVQSSTPANNAMRTYTVVVTRQPESQTPTVGFTTTTVATDEGDAIRFTVELSEPVDAFTDVFFTVAGSGANPASSNVDYDLGAHTGGVLSFPPNLTSRPLTFNTIEDAVVEEDETFTITLTGLRLPSGVTLGAATTATGTIRDDDTGNNAPVASGTVPAVTVDEGDAAATRDVAARFSDPDGDTLTYTAESDDEAVATVSVSGSTVTITPGAAGTATVTVTATDTGGLTATRDIAVTVNAVGPPTVTASGAYSVPEDAASSTDVGAALTTRGFPGSGGAWSITAGNTGGAFSISSAGQIQVAAALDHETTPSYTLTVQFAQGGATATAMVTVTVTDANEAPTPTGTIDPVTVGVGADPVAVDVSGSFSDPDGDTLSYRAASNRTTVATVSVSGSIVTITPVREGIATIVVTATDTRGQATTRDIAVTVSVLPTVPTVTASGPHVITEDAAPGLNVGRPLTASAFPGSGGSWSITAGNTGGAFSISNTGQIQVAGALDHETTPSYTLTVQFAQGGETATASVTVAVTDVNEVDVTSSVIASVTVEVDGDPVELDLSASFSDPEDPEGDALTYSATSDDVAVATVEVTGSILTITPVAMGTATVTVTATDPSRVEATATVAVRVGTFAGESPERVAESVLPHVAQAAVAGTLSAITGRIEAAVGAAPLRASGLDPLQALKASGRGLEEGTTDLARALGGSSFVTPLNAAHDGSSGRVGEAAVWGGGDWRRLSGPDDDMTDWDGNMFSFHLGADMRMGPGLLAGLAVSHSSGSFDYTDRAGPQPVEGEYDSRMVGLHPYVSWSPAGGPRLWATAGYGWGDIEIREENQPARTSDTEMWSAGVGGSHVLVSDDGMIPGGAATLRLKGEGALASIDVEGREQIRPAEFDVQHVRAALEGSYECLPGAAGGCLSPSVEVGVRHDSGDARTGTGVEVGGGLRYADRTMGLTLEIRGRALVVDADDHEDWGVGGLIRLDPGKGGRGLSLRLAPGLGEAADGAGRLYDTGAFGATEDGRAPSGRLDAEIGYGFIAGGDPQGVLTPYAALSLAEEDSRSWRVGGRLEVGPSLSLNLEGQRRESATGGPDHGIMARGRLVW